MEWDKGDKKSLTIKRFLQVASNCTCSRVPSTQPRSPASRSGGQWPTATLGEQSVGKWVVNSNWTIRDCSCDSVIRSIADMAVRNSRYQRGMQFKIWRGFQLLPSESWGGRLPAKLARNDSREKSWNLPDFSKFDAEQFPVNFCQLFSPWQIEGDFRGNYTL